MPRQCIFCDRRATTIEHAWPAWMIEYLTANQPAITSAQFGPSAPTRHWHDRPIEVRCLCGTCNHTWMSDLEQRTAPIMRAMFNDLSLVLDEDLQHTIARWALKTVMVFDNVRRVNRYYRDEELVRFGATREAPPVTRVWIGHSRRSDAIFTMARRMSNNSGSPWPLSEGLVATLCFSRVVLQMLSVRPRSDLGPARVRLEARGAWSGALHQLLPSAAGRVSWPPSQSLVGTTESLEALANRFARATDAAT